MYTTLFSLLLASTGLASGAQDEGYGTFGSYGQLGRYSGGYYPYQYVYPSQWPIETSRPEDPAIKDIRKQLADTTTAYNTLLNKLKDIELRTELNGGINDKLADALAKLAENHERKAAEAFNAKLTEALAGIDRKVADAVNAKVEEMKKDPASNLVRLSELSRLDEMSRRLDAFEKDFKTQNDRLRAFEQKENFNKQEAIAQANNEMMQKMIGLLEKMATTNDAIVPVLRDIKKIADKEPPSPKIEHKALTGHPLTRCLIIVNLPADAELYLDEQQSKVGTNLRTFISPDLEPNKNYFYNLRVELKRNDKVFTDNQKIFFQAGREYYVNFDYLETSIANELKKVK